MKKLFLLIPALVLSIAMNAAVINITPTSPHSSNNLRQALAAAATGDIIEMAAGTYVETGNWLAVDDKEVTVRAAAGAEVIIKPQFSVRIKAGTTNLVGKAEFIGVKFDCSALESDQLIVPSNDNANQSVVLKNCEFYDWSKNEALIKTTGERRLDAIEIDNCYFHGFEKSILFLQNANPVSLSVTNSTFANVAGAAGYYAAPIDVRAASGDVLVDHCTFYNVRNMSLSYGVVTVTTISNVTLSNSIFMLPVSEDMCTSNLPTGSEVKNCLTFNYDNWQPYGHYTTATVTDCVKANPLFKDAANSDFSLYAASPARGAGLAGSNLGDLRWAKALDPVAIPATLVPFDALLSANTSIIQSDPDSIFLKSQADIEWAKWSISVAESGLYDFTAYAKRTDSSGSQRLQILVMNSDESDTLKDNAKTGLPNECTISSGAVNLEAGNTYVIKVLNNYKWAESKLIKVEASYAGGKTIAVPDTLWPVDALKSEYAFVNEDGELRFTDNDHTGYVPSQWGKWNIHVSKGGIYNFTLEAFSSNSHHYYLSVLNTDESQIEKYTLDGSSGQVLKATTANLELAAGDYIIKIENFTQYSQGCVRKIIANYEGGAVTAIPGQLLGEDALLYKSGSKYMIRTEEGYLKSSNNGSPTTEWAVWNITASAGALNVTLNLDPVTSSGHNYRVELYQGEELKDYTQELESAEGSAAVHTKGNIALEKTLVVPADGSYTIKLVNRTQWSSMILQSITFTEIVPPTVVAMDEMAEDNTAWVSHVGGAAVNVQLTRTIVAGMYNTICLPFDVDGTQTKAIFGSDVELYTLGTTAYENEVLTLNVDPASDIYHGTPYLIKTSADVVNPQFEGVQILSEVPANTSSTYVDFIGNFIKSEVPAGENNLFLGPNDLLYFSQTATPIKGMRAYFRVNVPSAANAVKRARIVAQGQVVTAIDLVGAESKSFKTIENGQLIITIDGVRYNVMGAKIQ